jgi:hypothetical protein
MQNNNPVKLFYPFLIIFGLSTITVLMFKSGLSKMGFSVEALWLGDLVLLIATSASFVLYQRSLNNTNPHFVLRMIYSGLFLKMFVCVAATVCYILIVRRNANKLSIAGCFVLYVIYTVTEIKIIMRLSRGQKNA